MTFKVYLQNELPEEYLTGDKGVGWFDLHKIYSTCPAKWKYEERDNKNSVAIAEHAAILNQLEFDRRFIRAPSPKDYPNALTSDADLKQWLKDKGVSGYSSKATSDLIAMIEKTGERPLIWKNFVSEFNENIGTRIPVSATDYDKILQMRAVIFANGKFANKVKDSFNDVTLIGEINSVKMHIRYDSITPNGVIIDYVGCTSSAPEEFESQARRGGYYLKQALLYDAFLQAYGQPPSEQLILAQERNYPHIPTNIIINSKHIEIGRTQYRTALELYKQCAEKDVWPTYTLTDDAVELPTPAWYAKRYGVEM